MVQLAEKYHTWSGPTPIESTYRVQPSSIYQLREEDSLKAQLALITRKLDALEAKDNRALKPVARLKAQVCSWCGGVDHVLNECL